MADEQKKKRKKFLLWGLIGLGAIGVAVAMSGSASASPSTDLSGKGDPNVNGVKGTKDGQIYTDTLTGNIYKWDGVQWILTCVPNTKKNIIMCPDGTTMKSWDECQADGFSFVAKSNVCPQCIPHDHKGCGADGNLYWFNSCNQKEDLNTDCKGNGCNSNLVNPICNDCKPNDIQVTKTCFECGENKEQQVCESTGGIFGWKTTTFPCKGMIRVFSFNSTNGLKVEIIKGGLVDSGLTAGNGVFLSCQPADLGGTAYDVNVYLLNPDGTPKDVQQFFAVLVEQDKHVDVWTKF